MKKIIACLFILQTFGLLANQTAIFSLTAEEMVFASKLSDENRRQFCYKLSPKERLSCIEQSQKQDLSYSFDQIVELMLKVDSLEKPFLR